MELNTLPLNIVTDVATATREAYLHNFWATLGFLLVAIGWFFTSESAQAYLNKKNIRKLCVGVVFTMFAIHAVVLVYTYNHSVELVNILGKLAFPVDVKDKAILIKSYSIPFLWLPINLSINGILSVVLIWLFYSTGKNQN